MVEVGIFLVLGLVWWLGGSDIYFSVQFSLQCTWLRVAILIVYHVLIVIPVNGILITQFSYHYRLEIPIPQFNTSKHTDSCETEPHCIVLRV